MAPIVVRKGQWVYYGGAVRPGPSISGDVRGILARRFPLDYADGDWVMDVRMAFLEIMLIILGHFDRAFETDGFNKDAAVAQAKPLVRDGNFVTASQIVVTCLAFVLSHLKNAMFYAF